MKAALIILLAAVSCFADTNVVCVELCSVKTVEATNKPVMVFHVEYEVCVPLTNTVAVTNFPIGTNIQYLRLKPIVAHPNRQP